MVSTVTGGPPDGAEQTQGRPATGGTGTSPVAVRGAVDRTFWEGRRVLVTGHTGFKGAWLSLWLQEMGAQVTGVSDRVLPAPSLFEAASVGDRMTHRWVDVRDGPALVSAVRSAEPEVVFHLAAQSLVRTSLEEPVLTYETNVMGTVHLLEAVRQSPATRVTVVVTSDKCYDNADPNRPHRESDPMGGSDPYASSKGCAELVTGAYRSSYFARGGADACRVATARAGNVIGGGDWSRDRILADAMRTALGGTCLEVRNPESVRPWQHVLNPLSGYLLLAQRLWVSPDLAGGWNFGPDEKDTMSVRSLLELFGERWPGQFEWRHDGSPHPHEEPALRLDSSLARDGLGWQPTWDLARGIDAFTEWLCAYRDRDVQGAGETTRRQVGEFEQQMAEQADSPLVEPHAR